MLLYHRGGGVGKGESELLIAFLSAAETSKIPHSTNFHLVTAQSPGSIAPRGCFFISPSRLSCVCAGGAVRVLWRGRFAPGRIFPALSRARQSAACCTRAGRGRSFSGRRRRNGTPLVIASASRAGFIPSSGTSPPDLLLRFLQFARGFNILSNCAIASS